jgi:hypothetical protein
MKDKKVQFIVTGFRQNLQFRMFTFERVAGDYSRSAYTVSADTALVRKHGISVQELPLLCLQLLERSEQGDSNPDSQDDRREVTFTEEDMLSYAKELASAREAAKQRRKMSFKNLSGSTKPDSALGE